MAWPFREGGADALTPAARDAAAWALRGHGALAYATLVVAGSVLPAHLRQAWLRRRNRKSGTTLATLLVALALSGLWLYYGGERGRMSVSTVHWLLGLVLPVWIVVHRARGLASRRQR